MTTASSSHSVQTRETYPEDVEQQSSHDDPDDSEFEEVTEEYLNSLLEKAKANMASYSQNHNPNNILEEVIRIDEDPDDIELPHLNPGELPPTYIDVRKSKKEFKIAVRDPEVEKTNKASNGLAIPSPPVTSTKLSKKEKAALREKTAGSDWFDLPAPDPADLPRLHREVEALRLHNSMDPKRFYKRDEGEGKGMKGLPKHFAIGTVVLSSTPFGGPSSENLARAERKRTLVDELVDDSEAKSYAKRKFEDLQKVRGAKGRGTLAKKKALRKQKW